LAIEDWKAGGFALYVHWPFCEAKCPYCDFNSHVSGAIDHARWREALVHETARVGTHTRGRVLNSIFFGGGTPSLMQPETVARVIDTARGIWRFANDIEITLEANPRSVEAGRFSGFSDAGVNRVSLGVQALRAKDLRRLGRLHDVDEALRAIDLARAIFDRVSFDLIYARQDQTLQAWEAELSEALAMRPDHLSLYQLTIEPGTAFWDRRQADRLPGLPDEDVSADLYETTQALCADAGLPAYEVSNHARPGMESRHNSIYWRGGDYAGIGPGAHGRLTLDGTRYATAAASDPSAWLDAVSGGRTPDTVYAMSPLDRVTEYIMMGLRLREGIDLDRLCGLSDDFVCDGAVARLCEMGLLEVKGSSLRATQSGQLVLNGIIRELLPDQEPENVVQR
jgi:oxygen-independent coproporphyrinogen-3 oxidase